jgi:hypothetical protein
MKTISLIRESLWNEAKWLGVAFPAEDGDTAPPILGLVFQNGRPATAIFQAWRRDLGEKDQNEQLYISIIQGISAQEPSAYRVLIGANPLAALQDRTVKYLFMVYRINTMEPSSPENLQRFLRSYEDHRGYILAPAVLPKGEAQPHLGLHLGIEKSELHVKLAWQVGRHDPEVPAIQADDQPIIPEGATQVPVTEVLAFKRRTDASDRHG